MLNLQVEALVGAKKEEKIMPDPINVTSYTTNEEIAAIQAYYTTEDGDVDYEAIAEAIETGESPYTTEDLLTTYVEGTSTLPPFMMTPEASIPDPDDPSVAHLWEEEVTSTLQQLADLHESLRAAIENFLGYSDDAGVTESSDLIGEIEEFLEEYGVPEGEAEETARDIYNLFNVNDLSEVATLFMSLGNTGFALLLYTAYGLAPHMQNLQEAALEVMEDGNNEMEELLDDLEDLDPEDLSSQYESQTISQQLSVIATVLQTMTTFIRDAQDVIDQLLELSSNLSQGSDMVQGTIIRNIGS